MALRTEEIEESERRTTPLWRFGPAVGFIAMVIILLIVSFTIRIPRSAYYTYSIRYFDRAVVYENMWGHAYYADVWCTRSVMYTHQMLTDGQVIFAGVATEEQAEKRPLKMSFTVDEKSLLSRNNIHVAVRNYRYMGPEGERTIVLPHR